MHQIAISNDITVALTPTLSPHFYVGTPGCPPAGFALDIPAPMYWGPGFLLGCNKLTMSVLHKRMPIVQDGHDCGPIITHIQCVPNPLNALTPLHILFSSRKVNFFSSNKVVDGKCIGIAKLLAWPPAPMTSCGEPIALPGTGVPTSGLNSVLVDLSWLDAVIGWGTVAAMLAFDMLLAQMGGPPSALGLLKNQLGIGDRALGKQAIATLSGAARMALTDGPANFKPAVGSPYLRVELGVSRNADGDRSVGAKVSAIPFSAEVGLDQESAYLKTEERTPNDIISDERRPSQATDYDYHKLSNELGSWGHKPL